MRGARERRGDSVGFGLLFHDADRIIILKLGGAFKYGFIFTSIIGELIQFDYKIFFKGVET